MKKLLPGILIGISNICSIFASELIESDDIKLVENKAHQLAEKYGKENVLIAYDIDDTLLATTQKLGGAGWQRWQTDLIKSQDFKYAVAKDMDGLDKVHSKLFYLGKMRVIDKNAPVVFNQLQKEGFQTLILTARYSQNRADTNRELEKNGFDLSINPLAGHGFAGNFFPYTKEDPENYGLTQADLKKWNISNPKLVSFTDGMYMTSAQTKGLILKTLFHKLNHKFPAVIFVDDNKGHTASVYEVLNDLDVNIVSIRYSRMDKEIEEFSALDKQNVTEQWNLLQSTLKTVFP